MTVEYGEAGQTENRITQVDGGSTASYFYDADGQRLRKTTPASTLDYVRNFSGTVLGEWQVSGSSGEWSGDYVYMGGKLLGEYRNGTTYFRHEDNLGSARVLTQVNQGIQDSIDYQPFGEQSSGGTATTHKFTGKERDSESGLDNFGARYNSSSMGRFMTPDWAAKPVTVPYAKFGDPQTLNLYTYVENSPLNRIDADGHVDWWAGDQHQACGGATSDCAAETSQQNQAAAAQNQSSGGFWQKLGNALSGNGWKTNADVANDQRQWLTGTHVEQVGADGKLSPIDWSKKSDAEVGASYNYMHQVMDAATANHLWSMVGVAATVTFGHGARHLAGTGLNQGAVESAIQQDVETGVKNSTQATGNFWGRVNVGGQTVEYRAYTLPNGTINVGTYYIP